MKVEIEVEITNSLHSSLCIIYLLLVKPFEEDWVIHNMTMSLDESCGRALNSFRVRDIAWWLVLQTEWFYTQVYVIEAVVEVLL